MCNGVMDSSSLIQTDRIIGGSVDVDMDAAIDSQLAKLPRTLLVDIQQHQIKQPSHLTRIHSKIPCSLLSEIKQYQNQEQQKEGQNDILDIVCGILQKAATTNGDDQSQQEVNNNCNFLSPMKKTKNLAVDTSKLFMVSLDDDSDGECQDDESQTASIVTTETETTSTSQDTAKKAHFNPLTSIQFTISREEMTQEEKKNYWLQDEEFALIRMRDGYFGNLVEEKQRETNVGFTTETYSIMPTSIAISPQHWICTRGLEFKMKQGFLRILDRRSTYREGILIEQERQWDEHWDEGRNLSPFTYDYESLAAVSSDVSNECKIHAENVAANDRREVEDILRAEAAQEESKE